MTSAARTVVTGQITYAARESVYDGVAIKEGDYMALVDGTLHYSCNDIISTIESIALALAAGGPSYITVFYGQDVGEDDARAAAGFFELACPAAEVTLLSGGQPVYYYLISAE
jgi:dihydroxyacetone kinase-like predicted kinase